MKILGAGLSRTGTYSLTKALRILGYPCTHFDKRFIHILSGAHKRLDLDVYDDLDSVTDLPTAMFYREFLERYPDLRVVLTHREEDAWWRSMAEHLRRLPIKTPRDRFQGFGVVGETYYSRLWAYGQSNPNEFLYRKKYREHNEAVRAYVPPAQLLEMDITTGDGWEKLCLFLGTETPDLPFPWANRH